MFQKLFAGFFRPPVVSQTEAFLARIMLAYLAGSSLWNPLTFRVQTTPVGLAHWLDLTWLADPAQHEIFRTIVYACLGLYAAGLLLPLVLPVATLGHILFFTLYNSQGFTHHGNQIVSLVLLTQTCVVLYSTLRRRISLGFPDAWINSRILWQTTMIIAGTYVVSVITKMISSSGRWLWKADHLAIDMVRTHRQLYYNRLDPALDGIPENAIWFLKHPWTARLLFSSGMILEAVSVFALGGRVLAFLIGVSLIAMHRSIEHLMGLTFFNNEALCLIYLVNAPFLLAWPVDRFLFSKRKPFPVKQAPP